MPYAQKQYRAAESFFGAADDNVVDPDDSKRVQAYDYYENLYINSLEDLKIVLRGVDQTPMLIPSGRKIVNTTARFLGVNLDYYVDEGGDEGTQQTVDNYWADLFKRENLRGKFQSNKRWGLCRGDAIFWVSGDITKAGGKRISIHELDPRYVFEIENPRDPDDVIGVHIVDTVQDYREPDKPDKKIARRRTYRKITNVLTGEKLGVSTELKFFEIGKWDDRTEVGREELERVPYADFDEDEINLPESILELPLYKWRTRPPQASSWGESILTGFETLMYGLNQSLSDEDTTMVFQGLGMYVTNSGTPRDPETGEVTSWAIGPKRVVEIQQDQMFERVSGVSDVTPYIDHMDFINDKAIGEAGGIPEVAAGRVDVSIAESGIALQLQLAPLLSSNAELEEEILGVIDQMFYDITTMWLPAYEPELFGNVDVMAELRVVCLFDDPMPKNRDAEIQETVLLDSSNLILKSMTVAKLRELGWKYPTMDEQGNVLNDEDIAQMLLDQVKNQNAALDPYGAMGLGGDEGGEFGGQADDTPQPRTIDLGVTT